MRDAAQRESQRPQDNQFAVLTEHPLGPIEINGIQYVCDSIIVSTQNPANQSEDLRQMIEFAWKQTVYDGKMRLLIRLRAAPTDVLWIDAQYCRTILIGPLNQVLARL